MTAREDGYVVCVRYWAGARDIAGTSEQSLPATSLTALLAVVGAEHGERMRRLIEIGVVLVDGEQVARGADQPLGEATIVEVLPPYAGG
jgi:molybdopterin converting factor small subunit